MLDLINQYIVKKLNERKEADAFRQFTVNSALVDFCSNDYLGLARSLDLKHEISRAASLLKGNLNGSTGARTITGTSFLMIEVESFLADFHRSEAALLYNAGYTANLGLFSALPYRGDTVLYDELIHASIRDGMRLSKANSYSFVHNDLESLENRLKKAQGRIYVSVESIYSMDGDEAPLLAIANLCEQYGAALIVDEAHSNGLYGREGAGLVQHLGIEDKVFARVMTFGKALGSHGAAVIGSSLLKDFLINFSRPFIYTTAPSPEQVLGLKIAYDNLSKLEYKRLYLNTLVDLFKFKLSESLKKNLIPSTSPIQCLIIPGNSLVKRLCALVQADGFDIRPIVAPTVPQGKERVRLCFHAFNTEAEVEALSLSINKNIALIEA